MSSIPESRRPKYFNAGPFNLCGSGKKEKGLDFFFSRQKLEEAINYTPRDDDLFVVTYPKNGTTWTQQIVYCLLNDGQPTKEAQDLFKKSPFLEVSGTSCLLNRDDTRVTSIKSHLPYDLMPKNVKSKYIVVMRNPKDTVVSFYHHTKGLRSLYDFEKGSFDDYFELFMEGGVDYGDYFDWILSWLPHQNDSNVCLLTYERMKSHPEESIKKLASFIGLGDKVNDSEFLDKVIHASSVKTMRQLMNPSFRTFYLNKENGDLETKKDAFHFVRKGVVNDWKTIMSTEQSERLSNLFRQKAEGHPELLSLWQDYSWLE